MTEASPRIVYMGTPAFAVGPLQLLLDSGCHVAGVITAPDRPAGRGKQVRHSEVKEFLLKQEPSIPLLQPENLKDPAFLEELHALKPELQVIVAFRMLPELVWRIPYLGTFNLHASLLPQYRGAAPINHVLINGEKETGVSTFFIDDQIDTGKILLQERTAIGPEETAGELHDRLKDLGAKLVLETVQGLAGGHLEARAQEQFMESAGILKKAPKIFKEDCRIDWKLSGEKVFNLIRGLSPYPGAFTILERAGGKALQCKIFKATFEPGLATAKPGSINSDGKQVFRVACPDGHIQVHSIQMEGKRRMDIKDFLPGFNPGSETFWFS
jgi:methionyl-tRNA formyltransferase